MRDRYTGSLSEKLDWDEDTVKARVESSERRAQETIALLEAEDKSFEKIYKARNEYYKNVSREESEIERALVTHIENAIMATKSGKCVSCTPEEVEATMLWKSFKGAKMNLILKAQRDMLQLDSASSIYAKLLTTLKKLKELREEVLYAKTTDAVIIR